MADFVGKLQELKEKITYEFDNFRDFNNNGNDATDQIKQKSLYILLFKIKYQIDQMKNDVLSGKLEENTARVKDVENQKADALIKLQTLSSLITSHAMNLDNKQ
ncbi:hypothetical protein NQ314_014361 [Rhamnusium bicolor]|uniref:Uncharacterized protein n=1 Tax=Rhamnusium bicolor TaxID=1586634 RepID=A0AAV8X2X8_9CUCU|nr:hypothetical protein NQ314_014361 [Rhamnusium bicolor]